MKREYPERPIVAVGAVITAEGRVALIRRNKEPAKGRWTIPGGAVELGETLREAARREAAEETGLDVEVGDVVAVLDRVLRDEVGRILYHYVIIDMVARPVGGTLLAGEDASDARWVGLDELDALDITEAAKGLARRLLSGPAGTGREINPTARGGPDSTLLLDDSSPL